MIHARLRHLTVDVEFKTSEGVTVLYGPAGAGKSLVLEALAGFVRPSEGRILLDDDIVFDAATGVHRTPQQRGCGYVFADHALFPHLTVRRNLEFAAERVARLERHRRITDILDIFRLTSVAAKLPRDLSAGQKQRCAVARAILAQPRVLLLDAPDLTEDLGAAVRYVQSELEVPILLATRSLDACFEFGDEILVLRDGKLLQSGPPRAIVEKPASIDVARLLGTANLIQAEVRALDPGRNLSRLRVGDVEIAGPYLRGRLLGDQVWLCLRPAELQAIPRNGKPAPNQIPATLDRIVELPSITRLEFAGGLRVETASTLSAADRALRDWLIEIPPPAVRAI